MQEWNFLNQEQIWGKEKCLNFQEFQRSIVNVIQKTEIMKWSKDVKQKQEEGK